MAQNTSTAVMAKRSQASRTSLNDFPTHPWAVRAFIEHIMQGALGHCTEDLTVWEPAANRGFMQRALAEYFSLVFGSDIHDYGVGFPLFDFLSLGDTINLGAASPFPDPVDWIISNPPFKDFEKWVALAVERATQGVALFGRLQMLETITRFHGIWSRYQSHALCAVYADRVPLVEGGLDPDASSATAYAWLVIDKTQTFENPFPGQIYAPTVFIPPCRDQLIRLGDYDIAPRPSKPCGEALPWAAMPLRRGVLNDASTHGPKGDLGTRRQTRRHRHRHRRA